MASVVETKAQAKTVSRPKLGNFAHVSVPCRDLEEGIRFYRDILGGEMHVNTGDFASFKFGDVDVGIGTIGTSYIQGDAEYPHIAFYIGNDELVQMKAWLDQNNVPTTNMWTRGGKEALMFTRDPSGNIIEFYCNGPFPGAENFPRGPARGHGTAVDIQKIRYEAWGKK
jgi:catechol 2,3-dioxygenase-like lactoylglutathione lyase family enzyme